MVDVLISDLKNVTESPIIASKIIFVQHRFIGMGLLVTLAFPKDMRWHII
jgi:hypothetical protein